MVYCTWLTAAQTGVGVLSAWDMKCMISAGFQD